MKEIATLLVADGTVLTGVSVGAEGEVMANIILYRGATGYENILIDSAYQQQIIAFTYPHIGNTGISEDRKPVVSGVILRDYPVMESHFQSQCPLKEYLRRHHIIAISEVDTRHLSTLVREAESDFGPISGVIITDKLSTSQLEAKFKHYFGVEYPENRMTTLLSSSQNRSTQNSATQNSTTISLQNPQG